MVEKFATGFVETGGKFAAFVVDTVAAGVIHIDFIPQSKTMNLAKALYDHRLSVG
jgi:hypothetical protein